MRVPRLHLAAAFAALLAAGSDAWAVAGDAAAHPPAAASAASSVKAPPAAVAARVLHDIPYGPGRRQRFDAWLPAKPAGPVLLMVHGGAWVAGDKAAAANITDKARYWNALGYVVVSTNYRLVPAVDPLEQARDVARALAKAQSLAASWGADPKRFVLMGHSAGGHLVALLNSAPAIASAEGAQPWRATVALDPGTSLDIPATMAQPHEKFYDRAFGRDPAFWAKASPRQRLDPKAGPMLILCSRRSPTSCPAASSFERGSAEFHQHLVIWTLPMDHFEINALLGREANYTDPVARWISSIL